ncbi:MAG: PspC domain-containing protein [Geodermatophilaceae bacterium]|nr:PspC domain-containing protein [Geodermatophilaceae bacterium]
MTTDSDPPTPSDTSGPPTPPAASGPPSPTDPPTRPDPPAQPDLPAQPEGRHPTAPVPPTASFGAAPPTPPDGAGSVPSSGGGWGPAGPTPQYETPHYGTPRYGQSATSQVTSRLQRSSSDRVLTGVCGGLGRQTGVDPILFRVAFVALVFAAGSGILLYLALAVLMPRDDGQQIWSRSGGHRSGPGDNRAGPAGADQHPAYGPPPPPLPKGPRSPVPGVTVALLLIGVGVIALGTRYAEWSVAPSTYFALAVAAVGVALLITALGPWQRSKVGLIVLGLMLSFGLFVTSAVDSRGGFDEATFGERNYRPASADQLRDTYQVVMGQSTLDLSEVEFAVAEPIEIHVEVTMGNFEIFVPRNVNLRLDGEANFGSVSVFGERTTFDGSYPGLGEESGVGDDEPELILDIDVRFGNAEVTRVR